MDDIVLGIDLGTTFSAVAYVNDYGKPEIIPNAEGYPTTPSVVHFYGEGCVVGDDALRMCVLEPENIVRFIKRHMGDPDYALQLHGRRYTPQEISAIILRKLRQDASSAVGHEVKDAVITVPAYFDSAQRGATVAAGEIAGLNVLSIINEPTAAAITYGLDRLGGDRKLLVFDLGGGTFDVTVMQIGDTELTTLASDGNAELGGKDWDDRLVEFVASRYFGMYMMDPRDDLGSYQDLYERCLQAKIVLSTQARAIVLVEYRGRQMRVEIPRGKFEELTADLVVQCADTCQMVLEKAGLGWRDLDDILLVGGSTRMPMVKRLIEGSAGYEPPSRVHPDECVSLGAALSAVYRHRPEHPAYGYEVHPTQRHLPRDPGKGLALVAIRDASSHPLGIIVLGEAGEERVMEVIPEGTTLPYRVKARFQVPEDETGLRFEVTEGQGVTREEVRVIGQLTLPPHEGGATIDVIYAYSADNRLSVEIVDVEANERSQVEIDFRGGLTAGELAVAIDANQALAVE